MTLIRQAQRQWLSNWGFSVVIGLCWVVIAGLSPWSTATDQRSLAVTLVVAIQSWTIWIAVTTALLVPSPLSLTVVRCSAPLMLIISIISGSEWAIGACLIVIFSASRPMFCDINAQGSAYGNEVRFTLRTPVGYMAPAVIAWAIFFGSLICGPIFIAARNYAIGVPLTLLAVLLSRTAPRRLHRLARRWLVVVPAGIVVHDNLVLADTTMVRKNHVASIAKVDNAGDTADLSGGVAGPRLAITMTQAEKVVLSPITAKTLKTTEALHILSFSIAPRRLDAALHKIKR